MKPYIHAVNSAKKFGGVPSDYEEIHMFLDSSKGAFPDNRHRALTHNNWFILTVLERIKFKNSCPPVGDVYFPTIKNSENKIVSVRDVGEQHILEDFNESFIPTVQDYFESLEWQDWFQNGKKGEPSSNKKKVKLTFDQSAFPEFPELIKNKKEKFYD
jgi:hypothetical protein